MTIYSLAVHSKIAESKHITMSLSTLFINELIKSELNQHSIIVVYNETYFTSQGIYDAVCVCVCLIQEWFLNGSHSVSKAFTTIKLQQLIVELSYQHSNSLSEQS